MSVPPSGPSPAAQAIITADKVMDFLPGASTLSNGVILITKLALELLNLICHSAYESIKDYSLVKHVEDKHGFVCLMLTISILNCFVAYFYHTFAIQTDAGDASAPSRWPYEMECDNMANCSSPDLPVPKKQCAIG